ncbi:hypothetical protein FHU37_005079 [Allostreptomyces psammosilenae]|uniref:DUF4245 domain-containing protein n=1 Tax=Allostreptomyces psammosilenae TaxID=1892865 RepID=A0A853A3K3_9ACTN|nr:hypothetical protein [Allostreptomyces psammosilenae]
MAKKRGRETVRDMVFSLGAVGIVVAAMIAVAPHEETDPVRPVDYTVDLQAARRSAPYPVLAPEGLPERWRATSVRFDGADPNATTWHLGFINPQEEYAAVEQSNGPEQGFLDEVLRGGEDDGTAVVEGEEWRRLQGDRYRGLVRQDAEGVTTAVLGTAPYEQLAELAGALEHS